MQVPNLIQLCQFEVKYGNNYEDLQDDKIYKVTISKYLANGGDGYKEIKEERSNYITGDLDTDVLKNYIEQKCPVEPNSMKRIKIICEGRPEKTYPSSSDELLSHSDELVSQSDEHVSHSDLTNLCDPKENVSARKSGQGLKSSSFNLIIFVGFAIKILWEVFHNE